MKYEKFKNKLAELKEEIIAEIISIISNHGDEIYFDEKRFKFNSKNNYGFELTSTVISIDLYQVNASNKVRITRQNLGIQFEVGFIEDELDIYQIIDFMKYMEDYEAEEKDKDMAKDGLLAYIWNDSDFKSLCENSSRLHEIADEVANHFRNNMNNYLLDTHPINTSWLEVCDSKYIINMDEVYAYFKIILEEYESK